MTHIELTTDRLALRRFTMADVDKLVELDSHPEVMHFLTGGVPTPRERIEDEILPRLLRQYENGWGQWAALERSSGAFLGWFGIGAPADGSVELGYRLHRATWGKGYATEGTRALVDKAFTDVGAQRVYAETMAVNTASRRVMEKAGLSLVRIFHPTWEDPIEGSEHGEVEYELRKAEWELRHLRT